MEALQAFEDEMPIYHSPKRYLYTISDDTPPSSPTSQKSARAHTKHLNSVTPVVPALLFNNLLGIYPDKKDVLQAVGRYWALKREARRGAPLLKRLHLEVYLNLIVALDCNS